MNKPFDQLSYMLALRQIETSSERLRAAYGRLEASLLAQARRHLPTLILDWLEGELALVADADGDEENIGSRLLRDAIAFAGAVRD